MEVGRANYYTEQEKVSGPAGNAQNTLNQVTGMVNDVMNAQTDDVDYGFENGLLNYDMQEKKYSAAFGWIYYFAWITVLAAIAAALLNAYLAYLQMYKQPKSASARFFWGK